MSYRDGWAAINLEMPERVPRTEYSAESHWELMRAVTGADVSADSPDEIKERARSLFIGPDHWNYDLKWSILIGGGELGEIRTNMGHAVYAAGGVDFDTDIHEAFGSPEEVNAFEPMDALGKKDHGALVRRFEQHYRDNCSASPGCVNMTGIYITCISALIDLFGWDMLLLAAGTDPAAFGAMTNRYALWIQQYFDALADAAVPVVMVHDDIVWSEGPFIHPDWYRTYVFPNYRRYFAPLHEADKKILFTSDGGYTSFVHDIADTGVHGFVLEPLTDLDLVAGHYGKTHVIVGNADTRVLLSGSRDAIRAEVKRCMDIGRKCPGFFLAVGNHIPSNTPVESAMFYNEVYEELSRR